MISTKIAINLLSNVAIAGLNFLALFFVARLMGPVPLGVIAFGLSFIGLFGFLTDLGFNAAHVKRISQGEDPALCNGTFLTVKLVITTLAVIAVLSVVSTGRIQSQWVENPEQTTVVYVLLVYFISTTLGEIAQFTFEGRTESVKAQLPVLSGAIVRTATTILVSLASMSAVALAGAYAIGGLVLLALSLVLFRGHSIRKPSLDFFRSYLRFALPVAFYSALVLINANLDKVMIGYLYHVENVAFYFSAQQFTIVILSLSIAVQKLLLPIMSALHARSDLEAIRHVTRLSERYLSMLIAPVAIYCIVFAEPLIAIFLGTEFLPTANIFRFLLVVTWLAAVNMPYEQQFPGTNRPGLGARIALVHIILNILLNVVLIPEQLFGIRLLGLGPIGAAIAAMIAYLPRFMLARYYVRKLTGTTSRWRILLHPLAASVGGGILYLTSPIIVPNWYHLVGYGVAFFGFYLAILGLIGEFTRKDYIFFFRALHPREITQYMASEIMKKE